MDEKIIDSMSESDLTPIDFITLMFERTDEDGILYIPGWHYNRPGWMMDAPGSTDENDSYRCKIDWNIEKYEKVKAKFEKFYNGVKEIAKFYDELYENEGDAATILVDAEKIEIWNLYLKPFEVGEFDVDKVDEIYDKLDNIAWVKSIAEKVLKGEKIEDFEKEVLTDYIDLSVSAEEIAYRQKYLKYIHKQAEQRLGDNICAHDVTLRAWRILKLFSLKAPEIIIMVNESRNLQVST